jgi:hemoglobin
MTSILDRIGGEPVLKALVERFYDLVESHPRGRHLMSLHFRGHGLTHVRAEQFDFLSGFLGGRRYYEERHGDMDVRRVHAHVPIRVSDAEDWLALMDQAIADVGLAGPEVERMRATFRRVALVLVNAAEDADLTAWVPPAQGVARRA